MLDDLKFIHQRDGEDALGVADKQWQQLQYSFEFKTESLKPDQVDNIVYAGMGGSAWPAKFLQSWVGHSKPFEIVNDYSLPKYVNEKTLVIVASYSGNTEETLSALSDAEAKNAQVTVLTSGGKLLEAANQKNHAVLQIPTGIQPRMSTFYFIAAYACLFKHLGLINDDRIAELSETSQWLSQQTASWRPEVAASGNPAKQLAQELAGKTVIVYSGPLLFPSANKFKICINESAKNLAWVNQYPEFNHNEFIGWSGLPVVKPFAVVEIRSNLENPRIQKRFEVSEKLLSGKRPSPEVITPEGDTILKQLLWTAVFCDFVSIYLALINNVDPTPVELVEKLKAELD